MFGRLVDRCDPIAGALDDADYYAVIDFVEKLSPASAAACYMELV